MDYSPVFLKIRTIAFSCISFTSFLWIILLCLAIFAEWDMLDHFERSLIVVLLLANTITVIMLLILLLRLFRPWLDAARCMFLLIVHIGTAGAFAYESPRFTCFGQTPDQMATCKLVTLYALVSSWAVPVLFIVYTAGLAYMVYRHKRGSLTPEESDNLKATVAGNIDEEMRIDRPLHLSITPGHPHMSIVRSSALSVSFPPETATLPGRRMTDCSMYSTSSPQLGRFGSVSAASQSISDSRYSTRLSKPTRISYY